MIAPTKRQREVLDIITRYFETNGYRPSYQRIAKHLGLKSRAGIARIVQDLENLGLVERGRENGHFSIKVTDGASVVSIGWLDVPQGDLEVGVDDCRPLTLPPFMIGGYEPDVIRAFRVSDSSMSPEIETDDIVLIELRDFCRDSTPVVALLNNEHAVLRNYYRVNAEIELRPTNRSAETIVVPANQVRIVGICRGLIRPAV